MSRKQKLNASGGTTCELVGVDDVPPKILWTPLFSREQGCETVSDEVHQDDTSAILLEENGRKSAGERTRALDVRHFVITDHASEGDLEIRHCSTEKMVADYYAKPLQGKKFQEFRQQTMGFVLRTSE